MTPDERQLITGLFDRMRGLGPVEKDRDAEVLINQTVQQAPDAPYMLVQSVLAQEHALQLADRRVRELEAQVERLEAQAGEARSAPSSGSFLGGFFGGSKPEAPAQPMARGSVPVTGRPMSSLGSPPMSAPGPLPRGQPDGAQPWGGGGFLRSALATAAGVTGGMLLADSIRGMLGASPAKAAPESAASDSAAAPDKSTSQEAQQGSGANASPEAQQGSDANASGGHDPHIQDADYGADAGDWGGGGDFEI